MARRTLAEILKGARKYRETVLLRLIRDDDDDDWILLESVATDIKRFWAGFAQVGLDTPTPPPTSRLTECYEYLGELIRLADAHSANTGPAADALTDNEYTILRALRDASPRRVLMTTLEADAGMTRGTCATLLEGLVSRGLADYDATKRVGAAITLAGKNLLASEGTG